MKISLWLRKLIGEKRSIVYLKCTMLMGEIQNMTTSKQKSIDE